MTVDESLKDVLAALGTRVCLDHVFLALSTIKSERVSEKWASDSKIALPHPTHSSISPALWINLTSASVLVTYSGFVTGGGRADLLPDDAGC